MAAVTVRCRGHLEELTHIREETISAKTVHDVIRHIKAAYGADAAKTAKIMLATINGDSIHLHSGWKSKLSDGDTVEFFPLCGGG